MIESGIFLKDSGHNLPGSFCFIAISTLPQWLCHKKSFININNPAARCGGRWYTPQLHFTTSA
jgi:hypothetical protein